MGKGSRLGSVEQRLITHNLVIAAVVVVVVVVVVIE
jgi:hypothetical protein